MKVPQEQIDALLEEARRKAYPYNPDEMPVFPDRAIVPTRPAVFSAGQPTPAPLAPAPVRQTWPRRLATVALYICLFAVFAGAAVYGVSLLTANWR